MTRINPNERILCPHCKTGVRLEDVSDIDRGAYWIVFNSPRQSIRLMYAQCPQCQKPIINGEEVSVRGERVSRIIGEHLFWPHSINRNPIPESVPENIAQDYVESAMILPYSPKASAALSRRCLQTILRESGNTTSRNLSDQIDEVLPNLPTYIRNNLDTVRVIGNFAAHQIKSTSTGEIIDVEPGEAEWNLDVLDALFDYYYERPLIEQRKRDAINQKLQDAGKPPLKA